MLLCISYSAHTSFSVEENENRESIYHINHGNTFPVRECAFPYRSDAYTRMVFIHFSPLKQFHLFTCLSSIEIKEQEAIDYCKLHERKQSVEENDFIDNVQTKVKYLYMISVFILFALC